jgi:hypothetical protein
VQATCHQPAAALPPSITNFFGGCHAQTAAGAPPLRTPGMPPRSLPEDGPPAQAEAGPGDGWPRRRGAVGCFWVEVVAVDAPREAAMLRWAAQSEAAALAHAYAQAARAHQEPRAGPGGGHAPGERGRKRKRSGKAGPPPDEADRHGGPPGRTEGPQPGPGREGSPGAREGSAAGSLPGGAREAELESGPPQGGLQAGGAPGPAAQGVHPSLPPPPPPLDGGGGGVPVVAEEAAVQAGLAWCGQQLLRAPQFAAVRRASLELVREREARGRPREAARARSASPALGLTAEGLPTRGEAGRHHRSTLGAQDPQLLNSVAPRWLRMLAPAGLCTPAGGTTGPASVAASEGPHKGWQKGAALGGSPTLTDYSLGSLASRVAARLASVPLSWSSPGCPVLCRACSPTV